MKVESDAEVLSFFSSVEHRIERALADASRSFCGMELVGLQLDRLSEFMICDENARKWERWSANAGIRNAVERLRELSSRALCQTEKWRSLHACSESRDDTRYASLLSASVKEECRHAQIDSASRVLFIGAGAFPLSAFTIARETAAKVFCLDIDEEAVEHGRNIIRHFRLEGKVKYLDCRLNGSQPSAGMTHVFVASLVPDKLDVIHNLQTAMNPVSKVIVRYGNGLKSLFNYPLDKSSITNWHMQPLSSAERLYDTLLLKPLRVHAQSVI